MGRKPGFVPNLFILDPTGSRMAGKASMDVRCFLQQKTCKPGFSRHVKNDTKVRVKYVLFLLAKNISAIH